MKKIKLLSLIAAITVFSVSLCGCMEVQKTDTLNTETTSNELSGKTSGSEPKPYKPESQVQQMTLKQKVGQMLMVGINGTEIDDEFIQFISECNAGSVILFGKNITDSVQLTELTNSIKSCASDIPFIIGMDEEGGQVTRLPEDVLSMPAALTVASSYNEDYCYSAGYQIGSQVTGFGLHTGFCPVMDIWTNNKNAVIGNRAFGQNADDVCKYAISDMKGVMDSGAIPVAKHFPGHGDTVTDSHYGLPTVTKTKDELWKQELLPFQSAIENNVPAIMAAHILCTELDSQYPSSLSYNTVTFLLREEMGFDGVVFTDDLTMGAITEQYSLEQAGVLAVKAGCDILSVCHGYDNAKEVMNAVINAVNNGEISEERINESVKRILKLKENYNVNSEQISQPDVQSMNEKTQEFLY